MILAKLSPAGAESATVKIAQEKNAGRNAFTGYGEGYVEVNGERIHASVVVSADRVITDWPAASVESLGPDHLAAIVAMRPEIVLLGTGAVFTFPEPRKLAPLHSAGIGVEVMDTAAACRTYNILIGEGRSVVAALVV
jgi:uncharacterized protein